MNKAIATILYEARAHKRLSQSQVAQKMGFSTSEYSKLENSCRKRVLRDDYLKKFSAILGISYKELVFLNNGTEINEEYYDTKGNLVDLQEISEKIHHTDADLLSSIANALEKEQQNLEFLNLFLSVITSEDVSFSKKEILYKMLAELF